MRAIRITQFGGPEVLQLVTLPDPVLSQGQVLIKVAASGVNRPDVSQRLGRYPAPSGASELPGLEVAGEIVAAYDLASLHAAGFQIGSPVCALLAGGGYAELCVAPLEQCLPKPQNLSFLEAACLPENFFTVWSNVFQRAHLQSGETILVQGGSSGIGVTTIMLAKQFGAKVIVTAGSDEKCQACIALGADAAINYRTQDFEHEVLALTEGRGVDVVLDMVAGDYIAKEINCLAEDGRLIVISALGGQISEVNVAQLMRKRITMTGSTLRPRSPQFKGQIAKELREKVWPLIEAGTIKPVVDQVFAAPDVVAAHQRMEQHAHIGKLVLDWTI